MTSDFWIGTLGLKMFAQSGLFSVYEVKQPQEKWACDFHDDAPPLSFQLQVAEVIF